MVLGNQVGSLLLRWKETLQNKMSSPLLYQMSASWGLGWGFLQKRLWQFCLEREEGREPITQIHKKFVKTELPWCRKNVLFHLVFLAHTHPSPCLGLRVQAPSHRFREGVSVLCGEYGRGLPWMSWGGPEALHSHHLETSMNSPF